MSKHKDIGLRQCPRCGAIVGSAYGDSCFYCGWPLDTPYSGPKVKVNLLTGETTPVEAAREQGTKDND